MLFKKERWIPWDEYFYLKKAVYTYVKITPDKSIRNYNSCNLAKAIAHTYKSLNRRIRIEQKKLWFETNFKVSYVIDITCKDVSFYFIVPKGFVNIILEKIREIWSKATVEEVDPIKAPSESAITYQLVYKKEDALSLDVDKKSNEPLNSILPVTEVMQDDDRITIIYNFMPRSQKGWGSQYSDTIQKLKQRQPVEKTKTSASYIVKTIAISLASFLDSIMQVICEFLGATNQESANLGLLEAVATVIEDVRELSGATKKKKELNVINTQMIIASESKDETRQENNALSVCQSYRVVDGDNELIYKKVDANITNIEKYKFDKVETNTISTDEAQNFIQIPGRDLLKNFNINYIKTGENPVPEKLQNGVKHLGNVKYKGNVYESYLENEYNIGNLPLVLIGAQGGGKTTYMSNYCSYCEKVNESVVVIDFIKNCELSESIKQVIPEDKRIEIDLGTECGIQGLGYNEIDIKDDMTDFEKLKLANLQSQQIMALVDSISIGDPLSGRMRRFLNSAANVVLVQGYNSVKSVIQCLEDFKKRKTYVDNLSDDLKNMLEDELSTLSELDEYSKSTKDNTGEIIGTKTSKIEHILDRIGLLREDFKLKYMYNKSLDNNINLVECMEQGKVVFIKMNENDFPTPMIKNILVTYWVSKIWLASQIRGGLHEKPVRTNIVIDEVFQAPTCMNTLDYILPQSRKFGCKFIFSTQYTKQLDKIFNSLEASGSSYMLLKGCTEDDFNHFKSKLNDYEYEDMMDMEEFSSMNLIYYSGGYASFISKLPKPIK